MSMTVPTVSRPQEVPNPTEIPTAVVNCPLKIVWCLTPDGQYIHQLTPLEDLPVLGPRDFLILDTLSVLPTLVNLQNSQVRSSKD